MTCKWWCGGPLNHETMPVVMKEAHWIEDRTTFCTEACWQAWGALHPASVAAEEAIPSVPVGAELPLHRVEMIGADGAVAATIDGVPVAGSDPELLRAWQGSATARTVSHVEARRPQPGPAFEVKASPAMEWIAKEAAAALGAMTGLSTAVAAPAEKPAPMWTVSHAEARRALHMLPSNERAEAINRYIDQQEEAEAASAALVQALSISGRASGDAARERLEQAHIELERELSAEADKLRAELAKAETRWAERATDGRETKA